MQRDSASQTTGEDLCPAVVFFSCAGDIDLESPCPDVILGRIVKARDKSEHNDYLVPIHK